MNKLLKTAAKAIALTCLAAALLALAACGSKSSDDAAYGEVTEQNLDQVCAVLDGAGLSNVDVYNEWVSSYLSGEDSETDSSGFTDADCRMTVMLLAGDYIECSSVEQSYDGTYLMFDIEAIEHQKAFGLLKEKEQLFTTLFGEMPIPESGFADAFPERLKSHGIRFTGEKFSIISILFKAYDEDLAFVGHTGILVDCRDEESIKQDYLFVEKLAFDDAYMATPVSDDDELLDILSGRPDYSVEENEPNPLVYKNDTLIGELSK